MLLHLRGGFRNDRTHPVVFAAQPVKHGQKLDMGVLRVVSDALAGLCGDNMSGRVVRAVEQHASRLRTELIKQLGESLVLLAYVRLPLAFCVRRSLGASKYRDRLEES